MNKEYVDKLYGFAKEELGEGFTKTREEFDASLSDTSYVDKLYRFAQETLGEGFDKSKDDFYSLVVTQKPTAKSPEEIKARGEEAYKQMQADIDTEYDKAYVEDNYGWIKNNPIANFGMSLVAPSSMESIDAGEIPSWGDIGIDVGINAAGLAATPERVALIAGKYLPKAGRLLAPSASRLKNIAVGAVEQGLLAGAGEGALSAQHDRDYSVTAPLAGTVAGGAIGGTATTSMAKKLLDAGYPQDAIADVMRKLTVTEGHTLKSLGRGGVGDLDQLGVQPSLYVAQPGSAVFGKGKRLPLLEIPRYKELGEREILDLIYDRERSIKTGLLKNPVKSSLRDLKELEDLKEAVLTREIIQDELLRKHGDGGSKMTTPAPPIKTTSVPALARDIDEGISNAAVRNRLLNDIARSAGVENELKSVLDKSKYQELLQKTPDVIESGTILNTLENVAESAPHSIKTARDVLKAPTTAAERVKDRKEMPKKEEPKYTNRSGYSSDGELLYAPRGYITYEDLWKEAEELKKKLPSLEIH